MSCFSCFTFEKEKWEENDDTSASTALISPICFNTESDSVGVQWLTTLLYNIYHLNSMSLFINLVLLPYNAL